MEIKGMEKIREMLEKSSGSGVKFFKLKNDGESAIVRFINKDGDDLNAYLVHKKKLPTEEGDREVFKSIMCYGDDTCPICRTGDNPSIRAYLFMLDENDNLLVWERGKAFLQDLVGYIQRYGVLNDRDYEIVRRGRAGDMNTKYQLFPLEREERNLPDTPEVEGRFVMKLNKNDLKKVVNGTYVLPSRQQEQQEQQEGQGSQGRRGRRRQEEQVSDEDVPF